MDCLFTTLGPITKENLGLILPHEHIFVDLRTPDMPGYAQAEAAEVVALMAPQIAAAQAQGVTALVECSTIGVGRRAIELRRKAEPRGGEERLAAVHVCAGHRRRNSGLISMIA